MLSVCPEMLQGTVCQGGSTNSHYAWLRDSLDTCKFGAQVCARTPATIPCSRCVCRACVW